jgi:hypothetical protein
MVGSALLKEKQQISNHVSRLIHLIFSLLAGLFEKEARAWRSGEGRA